MIPSKPMGLATGPIYQRQTPVRDANYLKFIRSLPSAVSGRRGCDACHSGPHGLGQKSSDLNCFPLTRKEHREYDADPASFCERHGLDLQALLARLMNAYRLKTGRAA